MSGVTVVKTISLVCHVVAIQMQRFHSDDLFPLLFPSQNGDLDFKNIDPEFVREPVPNSVGKSCTANISASVQEADNAFMGFTYVPPTDLE